MHYDRRAPDGWPVSTARTGTRPDEPWSGPDRFGKVLGYAYGWIVMSERRSVISFCASAALSCTSSLE
jgi:hypothetical protein